MSTVHAIPLADTWMHGGWGWGWMSLMMVMMVVFWGAIIAAVVWLIRGVSRERSPSTETPEAILDRRFAAGEIGEEDYRARRDALARRSEPVVRT